jgi:putative ABC transport system ATP-binding protein
MNGSAQLLLDCRDVGVTLGHGDASVAALAGVDLKVRDGDRIALWGRSGSGKSTLLHALSGLVAPTSGEILWRGRPLSDFGQADRWIRRPAGIANVFQSPNLLPYFTAFENVSFAVQAAWQQNDGDGSRQTGTVLSANDLLGLVGLEDKADALPAELSGGEAQRVAVARALAQRPLVLLCDEPTGHLDSDTGERVLALIDALQREWGFALLTATHDADVAARFSRLVELLDGRVVRNEVDR